MRNREFKGMNPSVRSGSPIASDSDRIGGKGRGESMNDTANARVSPIFEYESEMTRCYARYGTIWLVIGSLYVICTFTRRVF